MQESIERRNAALGVKEFVLKDGKRLCVRPLLPEDVEEVSRIEEASFSMPWQPQAFMDMTDREDSLYVTGLVDGRPVGCCGATNACGDGNINNVVVEEKLRGLGVASGMLAALIEWGSVVGMERYTLEVRLSNAPAIRVYEKLGFVNEGIRPGFYERPREDAMIMWRR